MRKSTLASGLALMGLMTVASMNGAPGQRALGQEATSWNVDQAHTEIEFSVRHFFTPVTGNFQDYDIELMFDAEAPENSSVSVTIDVTSVDTDNERRDNHLRSADFFDAEKYPTMTFESTSVRQVGENQFLATGNLTIKETTREVELTIELLGIQPLPPEMQEMMGGVTRVASFQASTQVDRREFEVGVANWAQTVIVGGEVDIRIALEANQM
jgi:polyisoprenoid-binding protein YceI